MTIGTDIGASNFLGNGHSECHEECFETKTAAFEFSELYLFFSSAQQLIFDMVSSLTCQDSEEMMKRLEFGANGKHNVEVVVVPLGNEQQVDDDQINRQK